MASAHVAAAHDGHHMADAAALPAVDEHVASGGVLGHDVEGVGAIGEVGAAEEEQDQAREVAHALVQEHLVEVGASADLVALGREEADRVVGS